MKRNSNYPKYVEAMHLLDEGRSINYVEKHLHIGRQHIKLLREHYLKGGDLALLQPQYKPQYGTEEKARILQEIEEKHLHLSEASIKYDVPYETLRGWYCAFRQSGKAGLMRKGSRQNMKKKRQLTETELDELEMLRKRNEYLEAENALLKKVKALVEEREARLRAIGQKPSKS